MERLDSRLGFSSTLATVSKLSHKLPSSETKAVCSLVKERVCHKNQPAHRNFYSGRIFTAPGKRFSQPHFEFNIRASAVAVEAKPVISWLNKSPRTALEGVTVFDSTGSEQLITELWSESDTILVALMRHFGCPFCWEMAASVNKKSEELKSLGVKVIILSVGQPSSIKEFCDGSGIPEDMIRADPYRTVYDALGLYNGVVETFFNPAIPLALMKKNVSSLIEANKNYRLITPSRENALQQGGIFVFKGDNVIYEHRDVGTGVHADIEEVMSAIRSA
mmetsp:Transcript_190/g.375  ORF Transcript_190/g.375 Transcript_190/m.375 type:complete len:277 (-) Transcript_190:255-1085(-)|eukprot:CAMPEP_0184659894 /NCGR_PEP_ID=MMETSP0308-20130426/31591_1 /TAXON_ID=38269 /ORGANISM="Gloeochaete witrockiana, Strain SAG 46.84" /LENGTH=276 /DNA_ID=CAMNT_0027100079 /DNA_START=152 /DNA_END=982 /DNA_ORIENTATION=-